MTIDLIIRKIQLDIESLTNDESRFIADNIWQHFDTSPASMTKQELIQHLNLIKRKSV